MILILSFKRLVNMNSSDFFRFSVDKTVPFGDSVEWGDD